jgi:hypothetical protein
MSWPRPKVVRDISTATNSATARAIRTTIGTPNTRDEPIIVSVGSNTSVSRPWAMTRASPRPPTRSASVATIGWI